MTPSPGRLAALALALALVALGLLWYALPLAAWLGGLRQWIVGLGLHGVVIFAAVYIAGAVVLAPEALLTVIAGFAYGFWGLPVVLVAATIGASLAFLIARYLARDRVRRLLARRRDLAAIDRAVAEDGWKIIALLRLSPLVPFNLQNYLFGVTTIPFRHFVAATFFGIMPGTTLYIYIGTLGTAAGERDPLKWALFGAGLVAAVAVVALIAAKARASLRNTGVGR